MKLLGADHNWYSPAGCAYLLQLFHLPQDKKVCHHEGEVCGAQVFREQAMRHQVRNEGNGCLKKLAVEKNVLHDKLLFRYYSCYIYLRWMSSQGNNPAFQISGKLSFIEGPNRREGWKLVSLDPFVCVLVRSSPSRIEGQFLVEQNGQSNRKCDCMQGHPACKINFHWTW